MDGMPPPGLPPHLLERLQLSDAQQDAVFDLFYSQMPKQRAAAKAVTTAREALRTAAKSDRHDSAATRRLADAYGQAVAEQAALRTELDAKVRALLSVGQRQRLDAFEALNAMGRDSDRPARTAEPAR
jgi:Spy/CpxP family protein refolding chaperone